MVALLKEAEAEISNLPMSPGEEDAHSAPWRYVFRGQSPLCDRSRRVRARARRDGKAVKEKEAEFAQTAAVRLQNLGLLTHSWKTEDPHDGE
jgi:hypothetical protein